MTSFRSATFSSKFRLAWLLAPLAALAVIAWSATQRAARYRELSRLPEWSVGAPSAAPDSPTGHAQGERTLVLHDATGRTFEWVIAVQQRLAGQSADAITFDNAPLGRPSALPVAYRALLGGLARTYQAVTGAWGGPAVDWVALHGGPLLFGLLVLVSSAVAWLTLGAASGTLVGIAWLALYPVAETFAPNLLTAAQLGFLADAIALLLLVGSGGTTETPAAAQPGRAGPALAGIAGVATGVGLATDPALTLPLVAAIGIAAAGLSFPARRRSVAALPSFVWHAWAWGGTASLVTLTASQPQVAMTSGVAGTAAIAVGWLALAELLTASAAPAAARTPRGRAWPALAGACLVGAVAVWVWRVPTTPFSTDLDASALFPGPDAPTATSFAAWFARDGFSVPLMAVLLPALGLLGWVVLSLAQIGKGNRSRPAALAAVVGLALVPVACVRLRYWGFVDFAAVVAFAAAVRSAPRAIDAQHAAAPETSPATAGLRRALLAATLLVLLVPGFASVRWTPSSTGTTFSRTELQSLVARDLAHWIHRRNADAIVLASPALTGPLVYYGGMRGIITFDPANRAGFDAASRIFQATTAEEAYRLMQARQITHLAFTTWDGLSGSSGGAPAGARRTFLDQVLAGDLPPWLRPLPYFLPELPGFTRSDIMVLEVVPPMERPTQLAALAAYFLETGQMAAAHSVGVELARYPTELNALVTRFEIESAAHAVGASALLGQLREAVAGGADADLTPDVRARVALALAHDPKQTAARDEFQSALADFTRADVLALTPRTLLRVLATAQGFGVTVSDQSVHTFAVSLLPPTSRQLIGE